MSDAELMAEMLKKAQWGTPVTGNGTPAGLGIPLPLFGITPVNPCLIAVDINIGNYVAGDDAVIVIQKGVPGPAQTCGYILISGGAVTTVFGYPIYAPVAPNASTIPIISFLFYSDPTEGLSCIVTQTLGGLKQVNFSHNEFGAK